LEAQEKNKVLYTIDHSMQFGCLTWLIPLIGLTAWAYGAQKTFLLYTGIIFSILIIKEIYDSYSRRKRLQAQLKEYDNTIIFFYPAKKSIQSEIKEKVASHLNKEIKQIYYDGPSLVGDIHNDTIIGGGLVPINRYASNHPRLIQIQGNSFIELMSLKKLIKINEMKSNEIEALIEELNNFH